MPKPEFNLLKEPESWREYTFPDGKTVRIDDVSKIAVSDSGFHRLECGDGRKFIIPPGWRKIEIRVSEWTF